jgi:hypothetical protein
MHFLSLLCITRSAHQILDFVNFITYVESISHELLRYAVFSILTLLPKFLFSIPFLKNIDLFSSFHTLKYVDYEITTCFNIHKLCILSMLFI